MTKYDSAKGFAFSNIGYFKTFVSLKTCIKLSTKIFNHTKKLVGKYLPQQNFKKKFVKNLQK